MTVSGMASMLYSISYVHQQPAKVCSDASEKVLPSAITIKCKHVHFSHHQ